MARLEYSQIVRRKLKTLKDDLVGRYGDKRTKEIISAITKSIRKLELFPFAGISVSASYDIESDYYYIFAGHNYFFYKVLGDTVIVLEMFNEKEDFMKKLFNIATTSQETMDYWDE